VKRFLWAGVLALFIHVLLLGFGHRFWHKRTVKPVAQPLSFTLVASRPTPQKEKAVNPPAKSVVPQPPEPEAKPILPVEPPSVIEEEAPDMAEIPEPETEALPEPEKVVPKVEPPPEEKPVKIQKPIVKKKPVQVSPKKVRLEQKKKNVRKKKAKSDPGPTRPEKKTAATAAAPVFRKEMTSASPGDAPSKGASTNEEMASASAPRVVKAFPAYAANPRPKYPRVARRRGYEGTVLLKVMVDGEGKVNELLLLKSSGHEVLDNSALKTVKDWMFRPGTVDGRPMKMWVQVPVRFELKGR